MQCIAVERDRDSHEAASERKRPFVWIDILINHNHHAPQTSQVSFLHDHTL